MTDFIIIGSVLDTPSVEVPAGECGASGGCNAGRLSAYPFLIRCPGKQIPYLFTASLAGATDGQRINGWDDRLSPSGYALGKSARRGMRCFRRLQCRRAIRLSVSHPLPR